MKDCMSTGMDNTMGTVYDGCETLGTWNLVRRKERVRVGASEFSEGRRKPIDADEEASYGLQRGKRGVGLSRSLTRVRARTWSRTNFD